MTTLTRPQASPPRRATAGAPRSPAGGPAGPPAPGHRLRRAVRRVPRRRLRLPAGLAVWMCFHDYFFAAPGAEVDRPFVGLDNYRDRAERPRRAAVVPNVAISWSSTCRSPWCSSLLLATALNVAIRGRDLPAGRLLRALRHRQRRPGGGLAVPVQQDGLVNQLLGPLAPDPSWLVNSHLAMPVIAIFVTWKQLGFFILLYLAALQNVPKELYESAADRRGRPVCRSSGT